MKRLILAASLLVPAAYAVDAELSQIQTIYLLQMGNGMDQYLANRITAEGLFQVVTDPAKADAIFTDQIGAGFEQRLKDLFPEPKKEEEKSKKQEGLTGEQITPPSSFSRGKGNFFLVDLKTKRVVWSIYERPKEFTPDRLDKTSGRIVEKLRKDLTGKK
ncbi:MAG: hypothetical protein FJW20_23975 [Acidimicrobiia bacterium]|nr:hypothetical protein [Acidimicrobiia bacterium]